MSLEPEVEEQMTKDAIDNHTVTVKQLREKFNSLIDYISIKDGQLKYIENYFDKNNGRVLSKHILKEMVNLENFLKMMHHSNAIYEINHLPLPSTDIDHKEIMDSEYNREIPVDKLIFGYKKLEARYEDLKQTVGLMEEKASLLQKKDKIEQELKENKHQEIEPENKYEELKRIVHILEKIASRFQEKLNLENEDQEKNYQEKEHLEEHQTKFQTVGQPQEKEPLVPKAALIEKSMELNSQSHGFVEKERYHLEGQQLLELQKRENIVKMKEQQSHKWQKIEEYQLQKRKKIEEENARTRKKMKQIEDIKELLEVNGKEKISSVIMNLLENFKHP